MNAKIDKIELQDRLDDIRAYVYALFVFASGLGERDRQAASGLHAILNGLEDKLDDARLLARGDDSEEPEADAGGEP
jgi:hypothetical protein